VPLRSLASAGLPAVLGTHVFLEFHFPGLCWQTVLGFWCSKSFSVGEGGRDWRMGGSGGKGTGTGGEVHGGVCAHQRRTP